MEKMKMLPILQVLTAVQGIASFIVGTVLSFVSPDALQPFLQFLQGYWPIYLMQVIPALVGSPLNKLAEGRRAE